MIKRSKNLDHAVALFSVERLCCRHEEYNLYFHHTQLKVCIRRGTELLENTIRKIEFDWKFDSYANPEMTLGENGLEVDILICLGTEKANAKTISLLKKHDFNYDCSMMDMDSIYNSVFSDLEKQNAENRMELLESIFNNAGMGVACFKFNVFDYTFYGNEKSIAERFSNVAPFLRSECGLYEEINSHEEIEHYIFIGRDFSLIIKTSEKFCDLHIKEFAVVNKMR